MKYKNYKLNIKGANLNSINKALYEMGRDINVVNKYQNYIKKLTNGYSKEFLMHPSFERNTISSNLFYLFCYLLYCKEKKISIDYNFINIRINKKNNYMFKYSYAFFIIIIGYIRFFCNFFKNLVSFVKIGSYYINNCSEIKYAIFTFIDEASLKKNYIDRYFPNICELGNINKNHVLLIPVFSHSIKKSESLNLIKNSFPYIICPEQILSIKEYFIQLLNYLKVINIVIFRIIFIKKFDELFDFIFLKELFIYSPNPASCGEGIIKNLRNKVGIKNLKVFINSFENLEYEKRINLALKKYLPNCTSVGFQHATLIDTQISNIPLKEEIVSGHCPDVVLSNGFKYLGILENIFLNNHDKVIVKAAPTLRYRKFMENFESTAIFNFKYCLILSSIQPKESIESISYVAKAVFEYDKELKIIVRAHPMCNSSILKENITTIDMDDILLKNIIWKDSEEDLNNLIYFSKYLFTCSTGSVLDILCVGKTPIIIGNNSSQMTMVPIVDNEFFNFIKIVFSKEDVLIILKNFNSEIDKDSFFKIKKWYNDFYLDSSDCNIYDLFFSYSKR